MDMDLLGDVVGEKEEKKNAGHAIGKFSKEEFIALARAFGREWVEPKDFVTLFNQVGAGELEVLPKSGSAWDLKRIHVFYAGIIVIEHSKRVIYRNPNLDKELKVLHEDCMKLPVYVPSK